MELIKITQELYDASKRLHDGSQVLFTLAKAKAEAEKVYRMALQVQIMELKENKLAATLIGDVARGLCADQKYERDLAEAKYNTGRDSLQAIRTQVSALQTIAKVQEEI